MADIANEALLLFGHGVALCSTCIFPARGQPCQLCTGKIEGNVHQPAGADGIRAGDAGREWEQPTAAGFQALEQALGQAGAGRTQSILRGWRTVFGGHCAIILPIWG